MGKRCSSKMAGKSRRIILSLSGGPDSVFLSERTLQEGCRAVIVHYNHRARGDESEKDREFVEAFAQRHGVRVLIGAKPPGGKRDVRIGRRSAREESGFEEMAREERMAFVKKAAGRVDAKKILMAHTADDQVETVLMRVFKGVGIAGLKGIPREAADGIERPILDVWREDILKYLKKNKIPYRMDKSNFDTRFERNWIRHVLIPLLEKRYGKSFKRRIFALGERFREIDQFLNDAARKWVGRNVRRENESISGKKAAGKANAFGFDRTRFEKLPSELRIRILQILCFEKVKIDPNERLLVSMDRLVRSQRSSGSLAVGKGAILSVSYDEGRLILPTGERERKTWKPVRLLRAGRNRVAGTWVQWKEEKGRVGETAIRKRSAGEGIACFDGGQLRIPLTVRPLRYGDRIRPFGMDGEKKVKEILIDRKVPREDRWGRPVVCDAKGAILWIPGVVRSAHAPVSSKTDRTVLLRISDRKA